MKLGEVPTVGVERRVASSGTTGRHIRVKTNSFTFRHIPKYPWYQYEVGITPDPGIPRGRKKRIIEEVELRKAADIFVRRGAYDGGHIYYHPQDLGSDLTFPNVFGSRRKELTVTMKRVGTVDFTSLEPYLNGFSNITPDGLQSITCLNLVLLALPSQRAGIWNDRNVTFFDDREHVRSISGGLELRRGFFQSVRPGMGRLLVQVNTSVAVAYRQQHVHGACLEYAQANLRNAREFKDILRLSRLTDTERRSMSSFLKNVRIIPTHRKPAPKRELSVLEVTKDSAATLRFMNETEGREESVAEYFQRKHGVRLQYPNLPCIKVGRKGDAIPMELCLIAPGQLLGKSKKLNPKQVNDVLGFATQRPGQRLEMIQKSLRAGGVIDYRSQNLVHENDVSIEAEAGYTSARVLNGPYIQYGRHDNPMQALQGAWNMTKLRVLDPKACKVWAIVDLDPGRGVRLDDFFAEIQAVCNSRGMQLSRPVDVFRLDPMVDTLQQRLRKLGGQIMQKAGAAPTMLLCILPETAGDVKTELKRFGDTVVGCAIQVVVGSKVAKQQQARNKLNQYCNNLALKINSKLGGINCQLPFDGSIFPPGQLIIMGADVSHPAPGGASPSVAALVSNVDRECARYVAETSIQPTRQEVLDDLDGMVQAALQKYRTWQAKNGNPDAHNKPTHVVFYRDGVSEGEFSSVRSVEVDAVKRGFEQAGFTKPVKLTFVVVGKHHHFRMFPAGNKEDEDRSGNCVSGTIVDSEVTNPFYSDFYLLSQQGIIGTSRPAHYSILLDEIGFGADRLQRMSYSLCHLYARATRAVSIPNVVYYADLVCGRWKYHYSRDDGVSTDGEVNQVRDLAWWRQHWKPLKAPISFYMYWM